MVSVFFVLKIYQSYFWELSRMGKLRKWNVPAVRPGKLIADDTKNANASYLQYGPFDITTAEPEIVLIFANQAVQQPQEQPMAYSIKRM